MAIVEVILPPLGESVMEATVLNWLKKPGEQVEEEEAILEVATDKVDTEIVSTHKGVLQKQLVKDGDVVPIGKAIALVATDGVFVPDESANGQQQQVSAEIGNTVRSQHDHPATRLPQKTEAPTEYKLLDTPQPDRFYSPLVRKIAKEEGISANEMAVIPGTGINNRVTKNDILTYLKNRHRAQKSSPERTRISSVSYSGEVEIQEMDRMRRVIAQRMVDSKRISPHVTSFIEVDVTNIIDFKNKVRHQLRDRERLVMTFDAFMVEAVAKALEDYPRINASIDGNNIVLKKNINVGTAVALRDGNLIVPVIKNANKLSLVEITRQVYDLTKRALKNRLQPDDLADGTFSISNLGAFGNLTGTPIILQPQVGILAFGAVKKKPAVIETPKGDFIGIRQFVMLSHSYDHRLVDGALGGGFLKKVAELLEGFDIKRNLWG